MALTQISLTAAMSWQLNRAITGFEPAQQGADASRFNGTTIDPATWTEMFGAQYTMLGGGTQVVDLRSFTDLVGNAVTASKALAIMVTVAGAETDFLNVKPNTASNALVWFFGTTNDSINIPGGGFFAFSVPPTSTTGTTVSATVRNLLLTNTGAGSLTVKVTVIVG